MCLVAGFTKHFFTFFSFFVIYIDKRKKIAWVEMKIISISKLRGVACAHDHNIINNNTDMIITSQTIILT